MIIMMLIGHIITVTVNAPRVGLAAL